MTAIATRPAVGLSPEHRRWLIINALVVTAFINALLNAAIAWATSAGERTVPLASIPLLQKPSTLTDTLGTLFVLPFITTILVTASARKDQRIGNLAPLQLDPRPAGVLGRLPRTPLRRATAFGLGCLAALGPITATLILAIDFGGIAPSTFVLYKATFGVGLGMLVTPVIALAAMADPAPR